MELYCIHLEEQGERLDNLREHLVQFGDRIKLNVIEGIKEKMGNIGCAKSHQKAVRYAKENGLDEIIVVEDDVKFDKRSIENYRLAYSHLPKDCDILLGGVSWVKSVKQRISMNLVKLGDFSASHFVLYRDKCYDKILCWNETFEKNNIDRYIGQLSARGSLNVYCCHPFIATQFS